MPSFKGTADERRDLIAFLSTLGGTSVGPAQGEHQSVARNAIDAILHPARGNWPTYAGNINGNRFSSLTQINKQTPVSSGSTGVIPFPISDLRPHPW